MGVLRAVRSFFVALWRRLWSPVGRRLEIGRAPDGRFWCCRNEENLEIVSERSTPDGSMTRAQCSECGRNHYVAAGDPKHFGMTGAGLTG